jgi:hypothetical protein
VKGQEEEGNSIIFGFEPLSLGSVAATGTTGSFLSMVQMCLFVWERGGYRYRYSRQFLVNGTDVSIKKQTHTNHGAWAAALVGNKSHERARGSGTPLTQVIEDSTRRVPRSLGLETTSLFLVFPDLSQ